MLSTVTTTTATLGARAALVLARNGYSVMELSGGFKTWSEEFRFATVQ